MLQFGKLIIWNNTLYYGNNANVPTQVSPNIDLSQYVTTSTLNSTLSSYSKMITGSVYTAIDSDNGYTVTLGEQPKYVYYACSTIFGILTEHWCYLFSTRVSGQTNGVVNEDPSNLYQGEITSTGFIMKSWNMSYRYTWGYLALI